MISEKFLNILSKCHNKRDFWGFMEFDGTTVLYFEINGFSKSGTVKVFEKNNKIFCLARYEELDEINDYDDLARIAWNWFDQYRTSGYDVPEDWKKDFVRLGYIEIVSKTVEEIIIK